MHSSVESHSYSSNPLADLRPWSGIGVPIQHCHTPEEALNEAGLNWKVRLEPVYLPSGSPVAGYHAVVRDSDDAVFEVVQKQYQVLQNNECFDFFAPFVKNGTISYEAAGNLRDGKRVWVLCRLNAEPMEILPGDTVDKMILLSNTHDGSVACRILYLPLRHASTTTLAFQNSAQNQKMIRIRHTDAMGKYLDLFQKFLSRADEQFERTGNLYRRLASKEYQKEELENYIRSVLYMKQRATEDDSEDEDILGLRAIQPDRSRITEHVMDLCETGRGCEIPGVAGTWWSAYCAITEFLAYFRGRTSDARLDHIWFGSGLQVNQRAFQLALENCG